ncbi:MAG TPA: hypothetical protein VMF89_16025, partial [Polyangiales bacterium]|nr:hypothetical protein [Polyangiales bacterium]
MLLRQDELDRIVAGTQRVVFRRWVRPTVRAGGTLRTPAGVIGIDAVEPLEARELSETAARTAGFESRAALLSELSERDGQLYRIGVRYSG